MYRCYAMAGYGINKCHKVLARKARHDAIAAYPSEVSGTHLDLDPELEAAGIDHLLKTVR